MDEKMRKKGQMTIWIIVGILLVAFVVLFFSINRKVQVAGGVDEANIEGYIKDCAKRNAEEFLDTALPKGGFLEDNNSRMYLGENVSYLCRNNGNYLPCINQHPMLINEIREEMKKNIEPKIENCFSDLKNNLEDRGYDISIEPMKLEVDFAPGRVYVAMNRKLKSVKGGAIESYDSIKAEIISPAYDLANVAVEIANQEGKYCYFEYVGYMILYPKFSIEKFSFSEGTKIYSIKDKNSGKEMQIAVRSCAIPPGI